MWPATRSTSGNAAASPPENPFDIELESRGAGEGTSTDTPDTAQIEVIVWFYQSKILLGITW